MANNSTAFTRLATVELDEQAIIVNERCFMAEYFRENLTFFLKMSGTSGLMSQKQQPWVMFGIECLPADGDSIIYTPTASILLDSEPETFYIENRMFNGSTSTFWASGLVKHVQADIQFCFEVKSGIQQVDATICFL